MNYEKIAFWFSPNEESLMFRIKEYRESQNLIISKNFIVCGNRQLFHSFRYLTRIEPILLKTSDGDTWAFKQIMLNGYLISQGKKDSYSFLECTIGINNSYQIAKICWKSKTGRIYETFDEDIDCNDIEFWFEDLDVAKVHELLYPKQTIPLALRNLNYKLELINLNTNLEVVAFLKSEFSDQIVDIANKTCDFVNKYNKASERSSNEERGFVHYIKYEMEDSRIKFVIDSGSAGLPFLKQLLRTFSRWNVFEKVRID